MWFMKSSSTSTYKRSFNKIDEFFSYVGGLIGTILGFMLFMSHFSLMAFELDLSQRLFKKKDGTRMDFSDFNVCTYFAYLAYRVGSLCGLCQDWGEMKEKVACKEEMVKQLDVKLLLQRLSFLERAVVQLSEGSSLVGVSYSGSETLKNVKMKRRRYKGNKKNRKAT